MSWPPPGWYPCPSGARQYRHWDGVDWTPHVLRHDRDERRTVVPPEEPGHDGFVGATPSSAGLVPTRRRRRPDLAVLGSALPILLLVSVSLLCVGPVARVAAPWLHTTPTTLANLWLVGWVPLTFRPVQRIVGGWFFGVRRPTAGEARLLEPCWRAALARAGCPPERFLLYVQDDPEVPNAGASGGHIVSVTTGALALPTDELEAILAHELGHHLGLHPVVSLVTYWLQLPIRGWLAALDAMIRATTVVAEVGAAVGSGWFMLAGVVVVLGCRFYAGILRIVTGALLLIIAVWSRRSEYAADVVAVRMDYGVPLRRSLQRFIAYGYGMPSFSSAGDRLTSSHPPLHKRIARIEARLNTTR